jgi:alpha-glucosidase
MSEADAEDGAAVTAVPAGAEASPADWWRQAAVYQIYPRSFADADGDGVGDLAGIASRIPYLAALGIDAVWLSPFYPSALADGGYDVDDYRDVDPRLGSLDDFDRMIAALHAAGIRLIADLVPNHSSDRHEWFRAALAAPAGSPERARYIFRDGLGPGGALPPSDWESIFGGSAWQRVPDGQYYLHLFAREQPDLNWDNPEVRADFVTTLRFWSDRGVDGFRVDVAHGLAKRLSDPLPSTAEMKGAGPGAHPLWDRDEVHDIYAEWRRVFQEFDPPRTAVAEAWVESDRRARYAHPEGLGQAFNFDLLEAGYDAGVFRRVITDNLALARESGSSTTWVFSNHDVVRHATRYGLPATGDSDAQKGREWLLSGGTKPRLNRELGLRRARAATLLMLALPGSAYMYQGEELGLHEVVEIPDEARQDPSFFRNAGVEVGRDGCRVPLPWTRGGASFGFGPDGAHLPQPAWFADVSVEAEERDEASTLTLYRRALALRRTLQGPEQLTWLPVSGAADAGTAPDDSPVVAFERPGGWCAVMNFGPAAAPLPAGELLLASGPITDGALPPDTTAWLRRP